VAEEVASILVVLQRHMHRLEKALEPLELRVRARESARVETSQQLLQLRTDNFTLAKHLKKEQANAKQEAEERNREKDEIRLTLQSFQKRLLEAELAIQQKEKALVVMGERVQQVYSLEGEKLRTVVEDAAAAQIQAAETLRTEERQRQRSEARLEALQEEHLSLQQQLSYARSTLRSRDVQFKTDLDVFQSRILGAVGTNGTAAGFTSPPAPAPKASRNLRGGSASVAAEDTAEGGGRRGVEVWAGGQGRGKSNNLLPHTPTIPRNPPEKKNPKPLVLPAPSAASPTTSSSSSPSSKSSPFSVQHQEVISPVSCVPTTPFCSELSSGVARELRAKGLAFVGSDCGQTLGMGDALGDTDTASLRLRQRILAAARQLRQKGGTSREWGGEGERMDEGSETTAQKYRQESLGDGEERGRERRQRERARDFSP